MKKMKANLLLLLAAFIWGNAFVAQSSAMDSIGPWTFTCIRSFIAFVALLPLILLRRRNEKHNSEEQKSFVIPGICCGIVLAIASMLQQTGMLYTTVGKAGFITALYVVLVPIFSMLLGKKIHYSIWICVLVSAIGLYLLCMQGSFSLAIGDLYVLLCAMMFAVHIMVIDHFHDIDGTKMSWIQFLTVGIVCFIPMILFENPSITQLHGALIELLYAGVMSSAVGYTLQIIGQKDADPTIASMLLSLESVFAVLAGFVLLHQTLTGRELLGCILMFIAIIGAQLVEQKKNG